MAGSITHLLVAEEAARRIAEEIPGFGQILEEQKGLLMFGAAAPDLPYVGRPGQSFWANQMHYRRTNQVPCELVFLVGVQNLLGTARGRAQLAFATGYVSHCATDATVHPIVQAIVGHYAASEREHGRCEMTQDTMLYRELKGRDLIESDFVDTLKSLPKTATRQVATAWRQSLRRVYPKGDFVDRPDEHPVEWFNVFALLLDASTEVGDTILFQLCKLSGRLADRVFTSAAQLQRDRPRDVARYWTAVPEPNGGGRKGSFRELGFEKAVEHTVALWRLLWDDVLQTAGRADPIAGPLGAGLPDWDLDSGADMARSDGRLTYWPV